MPFQFTLATLLRVRESIEKREEIALQRAEAEVVRARQQIEELTSRIAHAAEAREKALQAPIKAHELQNMEAELNAVVAARTALIQRLQVLKEQREAQMKRYQAAYSNRQMLTDLSTQQRNEYEQEETRAQQKRIDDIFAARMQRS
ncbi:MAG TPA: flagellar export protein FliJ [Terracidiphilus sp.]|nr:flagellar export protein FliJ [Terracidiphilus sp.]